MFYLTGQLPYQEVFNHICCNQVNCEGSGYYVSRSNVLFMFHLLTTSPFVVVDTNLRNGRGLTVLHVAAWRREPQIIGSLLDKGARLDELTMNNQRAIDISRRLASILDSEQEENKKDRLCIDLLEQAEKRHTIPSAAVLNVPSTEEELMSMLLYLENRGQSLGIYSSHQQDSILVGAFAFRLLIPGVNNQRSRHTKC